MLYRLLADCVLLLHFAFVAFVVGGGLLVLCWPRWATLHVPAALWGVVVEYSGAICPLTPLEVAWRERGGGAGYAGGFLDHYLTAVLYPAGLTRRAQLALGTIVLATNAVVYATLVVRWRRRAQVRLKSIQP
jgi:uncharacterized membrane protein YhhN